MRRRSIVVWAMVLTGAMVLSACSNSAGNNSAGQSDGSAHSQAETSETPAADMKLRILAANIGGKTPEENTLFEQEIEKSTGMEVTLEKPASDYDQKVLTALSSGEKYDLIEISDLSKLREFVNQGVVTDLTDFVKNSSILSDSKVIPSEEWDLVKGDDGNIYGVFTKFQGATMLTVRMDWLEKLKLDVPTTLNDLYTVLKAFKEQDPDGNGKDDTYGLSTSALYDIQGIMSAAGLKYRYVMEDGKRTIPYATEAAIPMYEWFANLVKEGIMDPNFVTNDTGQMRNLFLTDRVGMVTYWDAWVGMFNNMKQQEDPKTAFNAQGIASIPAEDGTIFMRRGDPDFWFIPANAEHPEAAKKFLEYWHTKDGIMLGSLGIEDHDYTVSGDEITLTQTGQEHNMDHGVPYWYNTTVEYPFGKLPGVQEAQDLATKYATLELSLPGWPDAEKIVQNYALKAMSGEMSADQAVKQMREELLAADLIDE